MTWGGGVSGFAGAHREDPQPEKQTTLFQIPNFQRSAAYVATQPYRRKPVTPPLENENPFMTWRQDRLMSSGFLNRS